MELCHDLSILLAKRGLGKSCRSLPLGHGLSILLGKKCPGKNCLSMPLCHAQYISEEVLTTEDLPVDAPVSSPYHFSGEDMPVEDSSMSLR